MRLALFGGTFDPIHNAHLTVAREAADQFQLDQVWFIPAAHPPHKSAQSSASYEDRYRMTELACQVDPRFIASRLEEGGQKSYTIDTIEKVRVKGLEPYFIIGADAFAEIATWHRWQDLLRLTDFIVVTRPGHHYTTPPGSRMHRLDTVALPVSSSDIRSRLAAGQTPPQLPAGVASYIASKGLYLFPRGQVRPVSQS
jgi:nicotinate-nucleotide adenylyltransferase